MRKTLEETLEVCKILYYGRPGRGKTTNLAHLAHLGETIYINAEAGLKRRPLVQMGVPVDQISIFPGSDERISYDDLNDLYLELKARLDDDPAAIAGMTWDSVTETQKLLLEEIVKGGVAKAERKGLERSMFDTYKEDWGVNTEQMRHLIRRFRDLPCHVGFAAAQRRDQDEDGAVVYGPAVSPALQTDLTGYVDIICYVDTQDLPGWGEDDTLYFGRFSRAGKYDAKDRFHALPSKLPNPTMDRVIAYVQDRLSKDTDPVYKEVLELTRKHDAKPAEAAPPSVEEEPESQDEPKPTPIAKRSARRS